jgi:hypothetical protein
MRIFITLTPHITDEGETAFIPLTTFPEHIIRQVLKQAATAGVFEGSVIMEEAPTADMTITGHNACGIAAILRSLFSSALGDTDRPQILNS